MDAEQVLDGLNDEQRRAVVCPTTPLCILAGAGTGKTRVLTRRIAYRALTGDHDPNHVLALTFTRKAAGELSARLGRLGLRDRVAAGTFHAIAYAQLRTRWADHGIRPPELLDRKVGFVARLLSGSQRSSALDIVTEIEWAKARDIEPDEYGAEAHRLTRRAPLAYREMAAIYDRYEEEKQRRRLVDFDDLLRLCRRDMRRDREFAQAQQWRYQHLFVDEFQDVNPLQASLLDAWLGGRPDLCVVGDPNQAIYGWNGADPTAITTFAEHRPGAETVRLSDNYRSSPQILAVANAVLAGSDLDGSGPPTDSGAGASALRANRPEGPIPSVHAYPDDSAEAQAIARSIRDHHRPGGSWSSQAVLCRTNAQVAVIEQALHGTGIPFRVRGGGGLLDQPEIKAALRDLRSQPGDLSTALTDLAAAARPDGPGGSTSAGVEPELALDQPGAVEGAAGPGALGDGADSRAANIEALVRLGHDYLAVDSRPSVAGFLAWLTATTRADQPDEQGDAVELATFHSAKGLEWPVVHLAGLEQGLVPIGHAKTDDELAEERRLFYVAITRAERELRCTWAESRVFGERTANRTASPYLDDIEMAARALRSGDVPTDWVAHIAAQRARLRQADGPGRGRRPERAGRGGRGARRPAPDAADLDSAGQVALDALKAWRGRQAKAAAVPAYVIFHDRVLVELVTTRPSTRTELLAVSGIGEVKVDRFGDEILGILAEHAAS